MHWSRYYLIACIKFLILSTKQSEKPKIVSLYLRYETHLNVEDNDSDTVFENDHAMQCDIWIFSAANEL